MGTPVELNMVIITEGIEKRLNDNSFLLQLNGYKLYPMDTPIELRQFSNNNKRGTAVIQKLEWGNNKTTLVYKLISLHTIN